MDYICGDCIGEEYLKKYIKKNRIKNYCLFIEKKDCECGKIIKMINSYYIK